MQRNVAQTNYIKANSKALLLLLMAAVVISFADWLAQTSQTFLLARASTAAEKEIAIRAALGASRMANRPSPLLTESLVLSAGGGALGIFAAVWGVAGLRLLQLRRVLPRIANELQINFTVLAFRRRAFQC